MFGGMPGKILPEGRGVNSPPGRVVALPAKIKGGGGGPLRAFAIVKSD